MMRISSFLFVLVFIFTGTLTNGTAHAQQAEVTVYADEKLDALLQIKNKMSSENKFDDGFTIQIYSGEFATANEEIKTYTRLFSNWQATIEYQTPNYKVWVGNFATRLEADRVLLEVKEEFENAFVLKPDRKK